jgi:hypothetical protein
MKCLKTMQIFLHAKDTSALGEEKLERDGMGKQRRGKEAGVNQ